MKEFLSQQPVSLEIIDVVTMPERIEDLTSRGLRKLPVVMVGGRHCFGDDLEAVASLIGIDLRRRVALDADTLIVRFVRVLTVACVLMPQIPDWRMAQRAISNRDRLAGDLAFHTVHLGHELVEGYPSAVLPGPDDRRPAELATIEDLVQHGVAARHRLSDWWSQVRELDKDREWTVSGGAVRRETVVVERQVWHSAQHARQLHDIVVQLGITPAAGLTGDDLDGLPVPRDVWG